MKPDSFDNIAKELFGRALEPLGFSCSGSKTSVFHRKVDGDIYHLVMPDLGTRGAWYDVKVFPFWSRLDPQFVERFPDSLGVPTDVFCFLSERGIGPDQKQFNCKSEDNFRSRFEKTVEPLLASVAVPYLDRFQNVRDLLPGVRNPLHKAIALHEVEGIEASTEQLKRQRDRLSGLNSSDKSVVSTLQLLDELLGSPA
ncbi:MAG: hypothetical protein ACF8AM_16225 [Rhodopirellula sp. JB055]|uniref:hypothetical protein n=1 Tax=Rhodopirellula sp. JB055 TaxID=3342846 RepID=UPI00370CD75B